MSLSLIRATPAHLRKVAAVDTGLRVN